MAAQVRLDMRGAVCPGPILEAKNLLKGMRRGEVLKLVSDCPGVRDDVAGWAQVTGVDLIATREASPGVHEFFLRKT